MQQTCKVRHSTAQHSTLHCCSQHTGVNWHEGQQHSPLSYLQPVEDNLTLILVIGKGVEGAQLVQQDAAGDQKVDQSKSYSQVYGNSGWCICAAVFNKAIARTGRTGIQAVCTQPILLHHLLSQASDHHKLLFLTTGVHLWNKVSEQDM